MLTSTIRVLLRMGSGHEQEWFNLGFVGSLHRPCRAG